MYVALFPLRPYAWIEEKINWRWRSSELRNGIVVEVGSLDEDGSLDAFKNRVVQSKPTMNNAEHSLSVHYKTRRGDTMTFVFGGERTLNGKAIDFKSYKLFNGPFIQSEYGSGIITLTDGNKARQLNFKKATITEWQPQKN